MFSDRSVLVVIPARGGSKGIPLKNLVEISDFSLIHLVSRIIEKIGFVDRAIVSTDHLGIKKEAIRVGLSVPFLRPENLSGDCISDVDVLQHALTEVEKIDNREYQVIVMLQPTCPFRKVAHIRDTVTRLIECDLDSVLTLSRTDSKYHPLKQLRVENNNVSFYDPDGSKIIARQQLGSLFHRNGAAYAVTRKCLVEQKTHIGKKCGAIIIEDLLVNIDSFSDIAYAKYLLDMGYVDLDLK